MIKSIFNYQKARYTSSPIIIPAFTNWEAVDLSSLKFLNLKTSINFMSCQKTRYWNFLEDPPGEGPLSTQFFFK